MGAHIEVLAEKVAALLADKLSRVASLPHELTFEVSAAQLLAVCRTLRDAPELKFEMLMDLAGVDYSQYAQDEWQTQTATRSGFSRGRKNRAAAQSVAEDRPRFAVVYHLLSVTHNERLRLRVYCESATEPMIDSVAEIWSAANWFEREAFDLYGIVFQGHADLRRLLTDYGFIGHPFRKDFPLIGNVEVRYDAEKKRVVYQPVSIEPRVLVPKVIREDHRYEAALKDAGPAKS